MYESKRQKPLSMEAFRKRLINHGIFAVALLAVSLFIGILGYHFLLPEQWDDATLDASMILGGMGQVNPIHTVAGKMFASAYAIFSGVVFIATFGLLLSPFMHRLMHKFHWEHDQG